jgi:hypothetical protein
MTFVFKHPSKYRKVEMTKKVKNTVLDHEYNYSYMTGTCVTNKIYTDKPKVFNEYEHLIEIKLDFPRPELQGEFDNKLMFIFPHHDNFYSKVKVVDYK